MSELRYTYDGQLLHLRLKGINNHELRCILVGLWRRLDPDDRLDFINELTHYLKRPDSEMPPLSQVVAFAEMENDPEC